MENLAIQAGTALEHIALTTYPSNSTFEIDSMPVSSSLADEVEQHVGRKVFGRVYGLRVEPDEDRLVLRGRCRTYYAKQIAQQAALECLSLSTPLINEIVISSESPLTGQVRWA